MTPTKFDSRKYLYSFVVFLFSLFVLYSFQETDLSNALLRSFDNFWLSLADKVTVGTYNFVSLIVKILLLACSLPLTLSLPFAEKMQYFFYLSFNSISQLLNGILSDLQKLLKYFNGTGIVAFFRIPLAWFSVSWAIVFPKNLAL